MSSQSKTLLTPEEYLEIERKAEFRSEYLAGEMFALAGASRQHNLIAGNIFAALHRQFVDRPCNVCQNDMRVKISKTGLHTYPDVVAVCGEELFDDNHRDLLLNPVVLIEVLSDSTEAYDRGKKFEHYQQIESLAEYLLVAQEPYRIERYVRQTAGQWLYSDAHRAEDTLKLETINCELSLRDVYAKVA
ncbi:MAG: Uma2 family endonuclease [Pyrinomonadaceae bacterium]